MGASSDARIVDVAAREVWDRLVSDGNAVLVDVRTRAEWTYVGVPDLSPIGKKPILIEWQTYPEGAVDPAFVERLSAMLDASKIGKSTEIFFICRSGVRSKAAALAMAQAGFERCHNVADGFEGPLDPSRRRGQTAGWKSAGLSWVQG
jgi:rhodanese-related sulfurtransferase